MGEMKGYTCDGGCGATTMLDRPTDTLGRQGWFTLYTPDGYPTVYVCSLPCLIRSAENMGARGVRTLPR